MLAHLQPKVQYLRLYHLASTILFTRALSSLRVGSCLTLARSSDWKPDIIKSTSVCVGCVCSCCSVCQLALAFAFA